MKSACNTWLNPIDGDGHAASQVTETPFDRGKVSYLRSSLQSYHLQVVSGSGSHARGLIRARLGIRSSCDLLPIRRRAPASYELATVSRFGAPRYLTRLGTGHNMISAYEHGRNAANTPNTFKPVRSTPVLPNGASGVLAFAPCRKSRRTAFMG